VVSDKKAQKRGGGRAKGSSSYLRLQAEIWEKVVRKIEVVTGIPKGGESILFVHKAGPTQRVRFRP